MAYPYSRKQLDDTQPLYAVRAFQWDGATTLKVGDVFDVEKFGARRDQLSSLWSQHYLDHERPPTASAAPVVQPAKAQPAASAGHETSRKRQGARP